ncbi:unnamed protein product [Echinostoma caproni]|uniref:Kinesin motor domain-containing protein n=1 Tax=Echinostoma caproni TaxID=27848 RepID=A0A183BFI9_9TREM|nr:unnamed protein product [Echinostoma caproni]
MLRYVPCRFEVTDVRQEGAEAQRKFSVTTRRVGPQLAKPEECKAFSISDQCSLVLSDGVGSGFSASAF